jgi:hypothetical protein
LDARVNGDHGSLRFARYGYEVICPRCRKKHVVAMLYTVENVCPAGAGLYSFRELYLVRPAQRALYRPKIGVKR